MPTVHGYADHVLVTTQSPLLGDGGHMHRLELDRVELFVVLLIMGVMSVRLLRWARRQGWW